MPTRGAFDRFAPVILQAYHRDKEAFWAAVQAPFLAGSTPFAAWWRHWRVDLSLLNAFRGLDKEASRTLRTFGGPLGLDVTTWASNRPQYFRDAYPVFAFLAVWLDEQGLSHLVEQFGAVVRAGVFAVAGYGILDANVDSDRPAPVEILAAQALIAEYETQALRLFGVSPVNLEIMARMRALFLSAEIREKAARGIGSPYALDQPEQLGAKGANSVTPFMLSLEQLGKAGLIESYWQVFLLFGAAIQMMDDWNDLETDLAAGHYSYVTLGSGLDLDTRLAGETAARLRADRQRVATTYDVSRDMLERSRAILRDLDDPVLMRLVDMTDSRVTAYFRTQMGVG